MDLKAFVDVDGIRVSRRRGVFAPTIGSIRVAQRYDMVGIVIDEGKVVPLTTPTAIKIALALAKQLTDSLPGEIVLLFVNRREIQLLPAMARKLCGGLIRKADRADDWQREFRRIHK